MRAVTLIAVVATVGWLSCSGGPDTRTLRGQVNAAAYGLTQPSVLVESANHYRYVAKVSSNGSFAVTVPAGLSYRVTLVNNVDGKLQLVSRVLWSASGRTFEWAKVVRGSALNFGVISPRRAKSNLPTLSNPGDEDDDEDCDENDDAQGDEQGQAPSIACVPKAQPPQNPLLCLAGTITDSTGDHDDGCDEDNDAQGDDDRDGTSSHVCTDGGVAHSGDDNNQGDDNHQGNQNNQDENDDDQGHGCVAHLPPCPGSTPPTGVNPPTGTTPGPIL
jgi:hypothetical protein